MKPHSHGNKGISRRTFFKGVGALTGGILAGQVLGKADADFLAETGASMNQTDSTAPLLLAHYMPWYQNPDTSGYWGWHWTMDHFNPSQTDENGRPNIASHYTPLTGPYDSSDDALLEYQVLLMKLSGIDGVIVDWYGIDAFRDYATLHASTLKLFDWVKKAGLLFSICYEDQTIKHMVDGGVVKQEDARTRGQAVMQYMQEHWFTDDIYVKGNGQPLLFIFGPQFFKSAPDWETMFEGIDPVPGLITLDKNRVSSALSSYPWPPMQGGITHNRASIEAYLTDFYRKAARYDYLVGSAFPAFHDIYEEAGVRDSYGYLDAEEGETFGYTLQMALDQNPAVIQLVTWNDYGEGTIIEPTVEFGYRYLEMLQETRRASIDAAFSFTAEQLALPLQLFNLRKAHERDAEINAQLDEAFNAVVAGEIEAAVTIIGSFEQPE